MLSTNRERCESGRIGLTANESDTCFHYASAVAADCRCWRPTCPFARRDFAVVCRELLLTVTVAPILGQSWVASVVRPIRSPVA
jgi:hypothetical protein